MNEQPIESETQPETTTPVPGRSKLRMVGGGVLGAAAGFAWYHFVGCPTGTCAMQANPYIMTGFGVLLGLTLSTPR